ncbi:tetratricopeptide repeat protein [Ekhidna sp.]
MKKAILTLTFLFFIFQSFGQADSLITSLGNQSGEERVGTLHNIVISLWLNYPARAMEYGGEALSLSEEMGDSLLISKSLRFIAGVYYYKGDYDESLDYNQKALSIAISLADTSLINNGYNNIGLLYYNLGDYQTAFEYLLKGKALKEKIGETYGLATVINNIGLVFDRVKDYEEARSYFEEAFELAIEIQDLDSKLYAINNIGTTYLKENKLDSALIYFREGLKLADEIKNFNWGSVSMRGVGETLMLKGVGDSVQYFFQKSLNTSQSIDDKKGMAEAYFLMSKNALRKGTIDNAIYYLDNSDEWTRKIRLRQQLLDNLNLYSDIYAAKKDEEKEHEYLRKYIKLKDSLFQEVVSRNLHFIPLKLKEEEDRFTMASQQVEIKNQEIANRLFTFIIIVTIPLLVVMIILLRKNHKKNEKLQQNNEELRKTQKLLVTSEKMASLGVLAAGVGHEINNPLNFIKNGIEALAQKIQKDKSIDDEELKTYFKIINEGVDRATNIVKSLSHFSRKAAPDVVEHCNIHEIIENCLLILHSKIRNRVRIITDFTKEGVDLRGNEGRLHQAMINIIANAEQAIDEEGSIQITTKRLNKHVEICIEDDGEGIPEENLIKISDPFFTTKAPGEGTGLGLFITFSIIEEHNGHIDVKSNIDEGTKFIITLPL